MPVIDVEDHCRSAIEQNATDPVLGKAPPEQRLGLGVDGRYFASSESLSIWVRAEVLMWPSPR